MKRILAPLVLILALATLGFAQASFTVNDVLALKRLSDPQLSPDGRMVAYVIGTVDKPNNRVVNQIHTINLDGSRPRQITSGNSPASSPRWSPDGRKIAFVTGGQIWTMDPDGDDKRQITRISTGAGARSGRATDGG